MSTSQFLAVVPLLPAGPSLDAGLAYYVGELGFEVVWRAGSMAGIRRGAVELSLIENETRDWIENSSLRIGVDDLDALHREYQGVAGRVGPLEMKPWGIREFHLVEPTGVCFQFYERRG